MTMATAGVGHELIQIYPNDNRGPQMWCFDWNRSSKMVRGKLENSKCISEVSSQMSYRVR